MFSGKVVPSLCSNVLIVFLKEVHLKVLVKAVDVAGQPASMKTCQWGFHGVFTQPITDMV
jgi:hypothetical protein